MICNAIRRSERWVSVFSLLAGCAFAGDGRHEISQAMMPVTLTNSGSYVVTEPLTGIASSHGITIDADHVTLDLNGFTLTGVANSLDGIHVAEGADNAHILNGIIHSWGDDGIDAIPLAVVGLQTNEVPGVGSRLENIISSRNANAGFRGGFSMRVKNCISFRNGGNGAPRSNEEGMGFRIENSSVIEQCISRENNDHGLQTHSGTSVESFLAYGNGHDGYHGSHACTIEGLVSAENFQGLEVDFGSLVTGCVVFNNGADEVSGADGVRTKQNTSKQLGVDPRFGANLFVDCVAVTNNGNGFDMRGPANHLKGCISYGSQNRSVFIKGASTVENCLVAHAAGDNDEIRVEEISGSRIESNHVVADDGNTSGETIDVWESNIAHIMLNNSGVGGDGMKLKTDFGNHGIKYNPTNGLAGAQAWWNFDYTENKLP